MISGHLDTAPDSEWESEEHHQVGEEGDEGHHAAALLQIQNIFLLFLFLVFYIIITVIRSSISFLEILVVDFVHVFKRVGPGRINLRIKLMMDLWAFYRFD